MCKRIKTTCRSKEVSLRASRSLFTPICIVMQRREIDLKKVCKYPLGHLPWSLAGQNGELKKTSKVAILHTLEKDVEPMNDYQHNHVCIIDGMALIQMIKPSSMTYAKLADELLKAVLARNKQVVKTDVVFDVYREKSIKNVERVRRSSGTVAINNIIPTSQVYLSGISSCHCLLTKRFSSNSLLTNGAKTPTFMLPLVILVLKSQDMAKQK